MIAIIDYGMGNLYSIKNAFSRSGTDVKIVTDPKDLKDADGVVIPGVGAFDSALKKIAPMKEDILDVVESGTPFMGICLGMQVLFDRSEEGIERGLGIFPGAVVRLPDSVLVPQIGWNELNIKRHVSLLEGVSEGDFFYFVHSYYCVPKDNPVVAASVEYGAQIPAVVVSDNVCGLQFHPEKSGPKGLAIIENFVGCVKC